MLVLHDIKRRKSVHHYIFTGKLEELRIPWENLPTRKWIEINAPVPHERKKPLRVCIANYFFQNSMQNGLMPRGEFCKDSLPN